MSSYFVIELLYSGDRYRMSGGQCVTMEPGVLQVLNELTDNANNTIQEIYANSCAYETVGVNFTADIRILDGANLFWIILFSLTTLLALFGNVLVVIVFMYPYPRKRCRTRLRPYLINLGTSIISEPYHQKAFLYIFTCWSIKSVH